MVWHGNDDLAATARVRCFSSSLRLYEQNHKRERIEGHDNRSDKSRDPRSNTKPQSLVQKVKTRLTTTTTHENIYTLPNILTFSRLIAAPAIGYLILHDQYAWATGLVAYASITDYVDGYIARRWNLQTVVGSVIDPMADKGLIIVMIACLAAKGALPIYLATLILGRDISLAVAAIYYRYASLPAPKTFVRYWDFSLPSAEVHPTTVSKYNTFLQLVLLGSATAFPLVVSTNPVTGEMMGSVVGGLDLVQGMQWMQILVAATTAWSGFSYALLKNTVKILGTDEKLKAKQGRRGRAIVGISFLSFTALATYFASTKDGLLQSPLGGREQGNVSTR